MSNQLQIPLFPDGLFEKVKAGQALMEYVRLQKQIEHLKHQRAGHIGAYKKIKKKK